MKTMVFISLMVFPGFFMACSCKKQTTNNQVTEDTRVEVRNMIKNMISSIQSGNREAYRACFTGPEGYLAEVDAAFDRFRKQLEFERELKQVYGESAIKEFYQIKTMPQLQEFSMEAYYAFHDTEWIDKVKVIGDGAEAYWTNPIGEDDFGGMLERTDDGWKFLKGQYNQEANVLTENWLTYYVFEKSIQGINKKIPLTQLKEQISDHYFERINLGEEAAREFLKNVLSNQKTQPDVEN